MNSAPYKAILFDLDGVLVDMPRGHYESLNKALGVFGVKIEEEEHYNYFNGLPTRKKIQELERTDRLPEGLSEFINSLKQHYTKEVIPKYCVPEYSKIIMLQQLKDRGFLLGCCSNSIHETLHYMLKCAQLYQYFDVIVSNEDVKEPKPNPEIYKKAFELLGVKPEETLIVEDSPHGIEAGKLSGGTVIEVKDISDVSMSLFDTYLTSK